MTFMKKLGLSILLFLSIMPSVIIGTNVVKTESIFIMMFIWIAYMTPIIWIGAYVEEKIKAPKLAKELKIQFYKECVKTGINDLSSPAKKQKAELIAQRLGCTGYKSLETYYEESKRLSLDADSQAETEKKNTELSELRELEQKKYSTLTKYAHLVGRDKRVSILTDRQNEYRKEAADLRKYVDSAYRGSQQKEIDWATHGGIASGIAGGAAGVAVALDAQAKNAQIRARNEANLNALLPSAMVVLKNARTIEDKADALQADINDARIKLVSDTPKETVFNNLQIKTKEVSISKTGAFSVKASISLKENFTIFDNVPAVIDGTLSADFYQNSRRVGSAYLVLPEFGITNKRAVTIEGICLEGAVENEPYEIKYTPHLLWEMEK